MKILFLSKGGDALGIAHQMVLDGHEVRFWVKEKGYDYIGLNLVARVPSWRPSRRWADIAIADMVGLSGLHSSFEEINKPTFGMNRFADMLELERNKQMEVFQKFGIPTPETRSFSSPQAALDLVDDIGNGLVIKPSGNKDTALTIVARDAATYRWALDQYTGDQALIVQKFVEGVEVSVEGWFNGTDWMEPFNHTFEEKRFLEGGLGPNTGCMGNVVFPVKEGVRNALVDELRKLTPLLRKIKYRGPLDINFIVNSRGPHALEMTPRLGYDAIEALHAIMKDDLAELLFDVATGTPERMRLKRNYYGMAVRLSVPPYPHGQPKLDDRGLPINGVATDKGMRRSVYVSDVYKDGNQLRWSAADGVLMKIASGATSMETLKMLTYAKVRQVKAEGLQYRRDIGDRVKADVAKLATMGVNI